MIKFSTEKRMAMRHVVLALTAIVMLSAGAAERLRPFSSVSDIEVEPDIKGCTYNKGPVSYFGGSSGSKSDCCACRCDTCSTCANSESSAPVPAPTPTPAPTPPSSSSSSTTKDSDGATTEAPAAQPATEAQIRLWISQLGSSSWKDAQVLLVNAGKTAMPYLIENISNSGTAYNLGGHTKADAGRASRQLTIGEVCAELVSDIVQNHSTYQGDVPGPDKQAWSSWWDKNSGSVTFAN